MQKPDIGYLLNRATRRLRLRLAEALEGTGLTPQQAAALIAIARSQDGCLTPRSLADAIDTDKPTTSGLIDRLSRNGWVSTAPNPCDGRSRLVSLTDKAARILPSVFTATSDVSAEATACLTSEEAETLGLLLSRLCESEAPTSSKRKAGPR